MTGSSHRQKGNLHARRQAAASVKDKTIVEALEGRCANLDDRNSATPYPEARPTPRRWRRNRLPWLVNHAESNRSSTQKEPTREAVTAASHRSA